MWFARLIRLPNLLVIALTQWLIAEQVLGAAFQASGVAASLSTLELWVLLLATALVSAAGYIVNDVADLEIDRVNNPEALIVEKQISLPTANRLAWLLTALGFLASLWLAWCKQEMEWLWLYPFFAILLFLYPRWLKTRPFLGNLWVAVCCAGVLGLVWLAERAAWLQLEPLYRIKTYGVLVLFLLFAFVVTWIREIVKDLEDEEGDRASGRKTLPITYGQRFAKQFVLLLTVLLVVCQIGMIWTGLANKQLPTLIIWAVSLSIIAVILSVALLRARTAAVYHRISTGWKFYMLGGLVLLLFFKTFL